MSAYWDQLLADDADAIRQEFEDLWQKAGAGGVLPGPQARRTLDLMFKRTHLDIHTHSKSLAKWFPTQQGGAAGSLERIKHLWWVDHATAGVNTWGTLGWFSSKPRHHRRKFKTEDAARRHYGSRKHGAQVYNDSGVWVVEWDGLAGAVTHFVVSPEGVPYYLVDLDRKCWGEPKRNRDGVHIEMVNALVCRLRGKDWSYWAGPIPKKLLDYGLVPVELDTPFRGARNMMPYTWSQVITNVKLKRLCIAATEGRMARDRMSQHTDWRQSKFDMGPLWPHTLINNMAFDVMPVEEYGAIQQFVTAKGADDVVDTEELKFIAAGRYDGYDCDDVSAEADDIDSTVEIQQALIKLYGTKALPKYGADGDLGAETCAAVRHFQTNWNMNYPSDVLLVDGIPGVETCARLEKALQKDNFVARDFD